MDANNGQGSWRRNFKDVQAHLFDAFFTTKDRSEGTGLGLSISHRIVKDHHGELHFECEPNESTCFHMDLPVDNGWGTLAKTQGNTSAGQG